MNELNPFATLRQIAGGYCLSPCLHVVAKLGVADKLDETPEPVPNSPLRSAPTPKHWAASCGFLLRHGVFES